MFVIASEEAESEREYVQNVMDIKSDFEKQRDEAGYRDDDTLIKLYGKFLTETEKGRAGRSGAQRVANEIVEYTKKEASRFEGARGGNRKLSHRNNKQMSAPTTVVMPTKGGAPQPSEAVAAVPLKGGALALSPLPLGGGKRRKTKKIPKKVLKLFKKGSTGKLRKLMKGGQEQQEVVMGGELEGEGLEGARRRRSRRGSRKTRRHSFLY